MVTGPVVAVTCRNGSKLVVNIKRDRAARALNRVFFRCLPGPKNDDPSLWESVHGEPTQTTTDTLELLPE
jgi:hypothetical protein